MPDSITEPISETNIVPNDKYDLTSLKIWNFRIIQWNHVVSCVQNYNVVDVKISYWYLDFQNRARANYLHSYLWAHKIAPTFGSKLFSTRNRSSMVRRLPCTDLTWTTSSSSVDWTPSPLAVGLPLVFPLGTAATTSPFVVAWFPLQEMPGDIPWIGPTIRLP